MPTSLVPDSGGPSCPCQSPGSAPAGLHNRSKLPAVIRGVLAAVIAATTSSVLIAGCASQPSQAYQMGYNDGQSGGVARNLAKEGVSYAPPQQPGGDSACIEAAASERISNADNADFLRGCYDALRSYSGTPEWCPPPPGFPPPAGTVFPPPGAIQEKCH